MAFPKAIYASLIGRTWIILQLPETSKQALSDAMDQHGREN